MKVVTWNMQGGGHATGTNKIEVLYGFFEKGYDVICLQEASESLSSFSVPVTAPVTAPDGVKVYTQALPHSPRLQAAPHGANKYTCYYYEWGAGNSRCSLATYVKTVICSNHGVIFPSSLARQRPMLWVQILMSGVYFIIGNVHLPSGNSSCALKVFSYLNCKIALKGIPYMIIGDFNIPVTELVGRSDANYFQTVPVPTQKSGETLDYCYYNGSVGEVKYSLDFPSDHRFLIYNIN
jgi:endonuclease/exonuclease/phosphatase family metal-dependent hydrolase